MSNFNSFRRPLKLHVQLGGLDTRINPQWMLEFKKNLGRGFSNMDCNIEIAINSGASHISLLTDQGIIDKAINFLIN